MIRQVCWDTETTGVSHAEGDRIVEIACVEIVDMMPTDRKWHTYLNPDRTMPSGAFAVHGLSAEFLSDKPRFAEVVDGFMEFIGDSPLVAHNAPFDMGFINAELELIGRPPLTNPVIDTLREARKRLGATARASLDALCKRFEIDTSRRIKHEAMLDTELLAHVYLHLMGGPHRSLEFEEVEDDDATVIMESVFRPDRGIGRASSEERCAHELFLAVMRKKNPSVVWDHARALREEE